MDNQHDWQVFREAALVSLSLDLNDSQLNKFCKLYDLIIETNEIINLTRITALNDFCSLHLLDSLTLLNYLKSLPSDFSLVDIGSGAGFPILPLSIILPDTRLVAVEAVQKKGRFIEHATKELKLPNVKVILDRSESVAKDLQYREHFDVATSRAVASLNTLVELCLPFLKTGGIFLAMKTIDTIEDELQKSKNALALIGGEVERIDNVSFCNINNHCIVLIRKVHSTSLKYPRKAGMPAKKPL